MENLQNINQVTNHLQNQEKWNIMSNTKQTSEDEGIETHCRHCGNTKGTSGSSFDSQFRTFTGGRGLKLLRVLRLIPQLISADLLDQVLLDGMILV